MTTRQLVEVTCDCKGDCLDASHIDGEECEHYITVRTRSNMLARWNALVKDAWSVMTEPRNGYGGRPPGRKAVGDQCDACTDWTDVEAVVRDTLDALGITVEDNLAKALTEVRKALRLPSGS